jgi:hypothetical protein
LCKLTEASLREFHRRVRYMLSIGDKVLVKDGELLFEGEVRGVSAHEDIWYYVEPTIGFIKMAGGNSWYVEDKVSLIK